jgi:hypothetical protein
MSTRPSKSPSRPSAEPAYRLGSPSRSSVCRWVTVTLKAFASRNELRLEHSGANLCSLQSSGHASRRSYCPSEPPTIFRRACGSGRSASPVTGTGSRAVSEPHTEGCCAWATCFAWGRCSIFFPAPSPFLLEVRLVDDEIVVSLPGTNYSVPYYKIVGSPGLLAKHIAKKDDPRLTMTSAEFLAKAWKRQRQTRLRRSTMDEAARHNCPASLPGLARNSRRPRRPRVKLQSKEQGVIRLRIEL